MKRQIQFGIKAQLTLAVCTVALLCLGVLSAATYVANHGVMVSLRKDRLTVIAQLKAAQVAQAVGGLVGQAIVFGDRNFLQEMLVTQYFHNVTNGRDVGTFYNEVDASDEIVSASLYTNNLTMVAFMTSNRSTDINNAIPPLMYPLDTMNTSRAWQLTTFNEVFIVGPARVGGKYYVSISRKLSENSPRFEKDMRESNGTGIIGNTIGYLTMIMDANALTSITLESSAMDNEDGEMALVKLGNGVTVPQAQQMDVDHTKQLNGTFLLSPVECRSCFNQSFPLEPYSTSLLVNGSSGSVTGAKNILGNGTVAVGYAPVVIDGLAWGVLILQLPHIIYDTLYLLVHMLIISVFSIALGVFVGALILSGIAVRPITRLQSATEKATAFLMPPKKPPRIWYKPWRFRRQKNLEREQNNIEKPPPTTPDPTSSSIWSSKWLGWAARLFNKGPERNSGTKNSSDNDLTSSGVMVPERVATRKWIKDELTDLTETFNELTDELRKQYAVLEERVIQRTKEIESARVVAESANKAKSLFIANITHELRTPLNGILGMTSVSMDEEDPKQVKESLKVIFKSGELLLHLLTDLLSFSKNSVGNMKLEQREFMIPEVIMQLNAIFVEQSRRGKIDLSIKLASQELQERVLRGDMNRILQIVINLVSNSLKFTPKGGRVQVVVSAVRENGSTNGSANGSPGDTKTDSENVAPESALPETRDGVVPETPVPEQSPSALETEKSNTDCVEKKVETPEPSMTISFEVTDTGPGIAPALQSKIFEPFVQGDLQLSERRVGAGLGLSICRQLAGLMHGSVNLDSELGRGSTFTLIVPLTVVKGKTNYRYADISKVEEVPDIELFDYDAEKRMDDLAAHGAVASGIGSGAGGSGVSLSNGNGGSPRGANWEGSGGAGAGAGAGGVVGDNSSIPAPVVAAPLEEGLAPAKRPQIVRNPSSLGDDKCFGMSLRVLVAEDNKVNQEVMLRMLKLEGIEDVAIANDGLEAVSLVRDTIMEDVVGDGEFDADDTSKIRRIQTGDSSFHLQLPNGKGTGNVNTEPPTGRDYDIIFMDVQMPNLDGRQATTIIRSELGYEGYIVAVSAFADNSNVQDCLACGMNYFLAKPLRRPYLRKLLQEVFQKDGHNPNSEN